MQDVKDGLLFFDDEESNIKEAQDAGYIRSYHAFHAFGEQSMQDWILQRDVVFSVGTLGLHSQADHVWGRAGL